MVLSRPFSNLNPSMQSFCKMFPKPPMHAKNLLQTNPAFFHVSSVTSLIATNHQILYVIPTSGDGSAMSIKNRLNESFIFSCFSDPTIFQITGVKRNHRRLK